MRTGKPRANPFAAQGRRDLLTVLELLGKIDAERIGLRDESAGSAECIDATRAVIDMVQAGFAYRAGYIDDDLRRDHVRVRFWKERGRCITPDDGVLRARRVEEQRDNRSDDRCRAGIAFHSRPFTAELADAKRERCGAPRVEDSDD